MHVKVHMDFTQEQEPPVKLRVVHRTPWPEGSINITPILNSISNKPRKKKNKEKLSTSLDRDLKVVRLFKVYDTCDHMWRHMCICGIGVKNVKGIWGVNGPRGVKHTQMGD